MKKFLKIFIAASFLLAMPFSIKAASIEPEKTISQGQIYNDEITLTETFDIFPEKKIETDNTGAYTREVEITKEFTRLDKKTSNLKDYISCKTKATFTYDKKTSVDVAVPDRAIIQKDKKSTLLVVDLAETIPAKEILLVSLKYSLYNNPAMEHVDFLTNAHADVLCTASGEVEINSETQPGETCVIAEKTSEAILGYGIKKREITKVLSRNDGDKTNNSPHKYVSVVVETVYHTGMNETVLGVSKVCSNFRYTKKMNTAECLSSVCSYVSNNKDYTFEILTHKTNKTTDLGCSTSKVKFNQKNTNIIDAAMSLNYKGDTSIDKNKFELTCNPSGKVCFERLSENPIVLN